MRRREFITLLGAAAATCPLVARAQQSERVRRVGILMGGSGANPMSRRYVAKFKDELAKLGWIEGRNPRTDLRFAVASGQSQVAAAELVSFAPDVIYVSSGAPTRAVRGQTQTIPIVFTGPSTPVADVNVARPEGNITGFPFIYPSIAGKWVELLKEADPRVTRVAVVFNPDPAGPGPAGNEYIPSVREAAAALAISLTLAPFQDAADLERTIDGFATEPNGGLIVLPGTVTFARDNQDLLRKLAAKHRLPTVHWDNSYPAEGGLMSYASSFEDLQRRAASYVDRILRGAKVSELPIERPTKFELIINLKAAKAIGLAIPEAFQLRADELVE
jgi:putative tryptophan/tyrosine transport system substrate-binding protein